MRDRHKGAGRHFEVVAGKVIDADGAQHRFAFVRDGQLPASEAFRRALAAAGVNADTPATVLCDGDAGLWRMQREVLPDAVVVLDWWHAAVRFEHALQAARGLGAGTADARPAGTAVRGLERAKWRLWHGDWPGCRRKLAALRRWVEREAMWEVAGVGRLLRQVAGLLGYLERNEAALVHYAARRRRGEPIATSFVESAVDEIIAWRMAKAQQMRWNRFACSHGHTHTYRFRPDVTNVMGYGGCTPSYFSEQQIAVVRHALEHGLRNHLLEPALEWSGWTRVQGGGTTDAAPAAAVFGDELYLFAKGIGDRRLYVNSARDGQPFGRWSEVPGGGTTDAAPAAAAFGGRLYLFAEGIGDHRLYVTSAADGRSFGPWSGVQGGTTDVAPAAAALGDRLHVIIKGIGDGHIHNNSTSGDAAFGKWSDVQGGGVTDAPLAAAALAGKLFIFGKGVGDDRIYGNAALDGQPFGSWSEIRGGLSTDLGVAATGFKERLYVVAVGKNGRLYFNTALDGLAFRGWDEIPGNGVTDAAPAVAVLGERVHVVAKGVGDKALYINSARLV